MQTGKNPEPRNGTKKISSFNYPIEETFSLLKPKKKSKTLFFNVLNDRKSERNFSKLSIDDLSSILWHSAKVKKIVSINNGYILTTRNYPSAGSMHPIDIFVSLPNTLVKRDIFYYNPFAHELSRLTLNRSLLSHFFYTINNCLNCKNSTIIWFGAFSSIVDSKYRNPDSLIWRDAGVLLMTFQLTASALSFNSCAVGTLGEPFFSKMMGNKINSVGGILIG
jgi:SagB-type dehydrogenase family enzyme